MKAKKPKEQYQTVTLFVRYYEDGKMEYCNPYNGEVLFTKQSPTGTSPLVELSTLAPYQPTKANKEKSL